MFALNLPNTTTITRNLCFSGEIHKSDFFSSVLSCCTCVCSINYISQIHVCTNLRQNKYAAERNGTKFIPCNLCDFTVNKHNTNDDNLLSKLSEYLAHPTDQ